VSHLPVIFSLNGRSAAGTQPGLTRNNATLLMLEALCLWGTEQRCATGTRAAHCNRACP